MLQCTCACQDALKRSAKASMILVQPFTCGHISVTHDTIMERARSNLPITSGLAGHLVTRVSRYHFRKTGQEVRLPVISVASFVLL